MGAPSGPGLWAITAGAPPSALTISTVSNLSARNSSATASALRCTSLARAGSALTDSMRTRSSRSLRMPGRTSVTRALMSSTLVMAVTLIGAREEGAWRDSP